MHPRPPWFKDSCSVQAACCVTLSVAMNIDHILETLNRYRVDYLLIGGVNFLLHHKPILTYDVDVWVADNDTNLVALNRALIDLGAAWGSTELQWAPVPEDPSWLKRQSCFCLTTAHGALDVFRNVLGVEGRYQECVTEARSGTTAAGIGYRGLSDRHMLECQLALDSDVQDKDRISALRDAIAKVTGRS